MIARIAIDLALDRLFDYEVPEALQEKLAVGQLLSVPFGHRQARGFVMEIGVRTDRRCGGDDSLKLRPVSAIIDETPFFTPALLEVVRKVASYTTAPLESVLKAALPAAVLKKNAHVKQQLFVSVANVGTDPMNLGTDPMNVGTDPKKIKLSSRQKWIFEQLVRLDGGWMNSLCQELKTTPATLKALAQLGLAKVEVRARRRDPLGGKRILPTKPLTLNDEQAAALACISSVSDASQSSNTGLDLRPVLLFGITGSGKTEVYLQAIARELEAGRGAIVMVPEIALTPQTVQRFASRFGNRVAVLHSALSDGERYDEWHRIRSGEARVVVGPRSAVWAPVKDLGLVVVDEEHETSYKQDETPRYHARDVAVLRGAIEGCRVVLGSATPSLESWMNVRKGKYRLAEMNRRAGAGTVPTVKLVDLVEATASGRQAGGHLFSRELLEAIRIRLDRGEQTILFLNRRGYSRAFVCEACARPMTCPACGVPYTFHQVDNCLRCHICGAWVPVPTKCPACSAASFRRQGIGTQRAEAALKICFPDARVLRMDADSTSRKSSHDEILSAFRRGDADILIGTQMIAKGLDFPNVTLVGVLNADASLALPDFRAAERTYQLLAQVSGRAGRAELPGEVIIQTHDPSAPAIRAAARGDFASFAAEELKAREEAQFPPYCHFAIVNLRSRNLKLVGDWAMMYALSLQKYAQKLAARPPAADLQVSDAMPAMMEKIDGWYRWQIVVRSVSAAAIARAWRWISGARPLPTALRAFMDMDAFAVL